MKDLSQIQDLKEPSPTTIKNMIIDNIDILTKPEILKD